MAQTKFKRQQLNFVIDDLIANDRDIIGGTLRKFKVNYNEKLSWSVGERNFLDLYEVTNIGQLDISLYNNLSTLLVASFTPNDAQIKVPLKVTGDITPASTGIYRLGSSTNKFKNIHLGDLGDGYIPHAMADGSLSNTQLYWDRTNKRLGVNTLTPQKALSIGTLGGDSDIVVEMQMPTGVTATAVSGGSLTAGTYSYRVVALDGAGGTTVGSAEVSATVDGTTTNAVQISWNAVPGASKYRVYGRTSPQNQYWEVTTTSFTDTGSGGVAGSIPTVTTAYVNKFSSSGNSWILDSKFGMGTATPWVKLTVQAKDNTLSEKFAVGVSPTSKGNLIIEPLTGTYEGHTTLNWNGYWENWDRRLDTTKNRWRIGVDQRGNNDYWFLDTYDGTQVRVIIKALTNGYVGIGATSPVSKVHIAGGNLYLDTDSKFVMASRTDINDWITLGSYINIGTKNSGKNLYIKSYGTNTWDGRVEFDSTIRINAQGTATSTNQAIGSLGLIFQGSFWNSTTSMEFKRELGIRYGTNASGSIQGIGFYFAGRGWSDPASNVWTHPDVLINAIYKTDTAPTPQWVANAGAFGGTGLLPSYNINEQPGLVVLQKYLTQAGTLDINIVGLNKDFNSLDVSNPLANTNWGFYWDVINRKIVFKDKVQLDNDIVGSKPYKIFDYVVGANAQGPVVISIGEAYTANSTLVYLNGQLLRPGATEDYTESSPSTGQITYNYAVSAGDWFRIIYNKAS